MQTRAGPTADSAARAEAERADATANGIGVHMAGLMSPADLLDGGATADGGVLVVGNGSVTTACFPVGADGEGDAVRYVDVVQARFEPDEDGGPRLWQNVLSSAFSIPIKMEHVIAATSGGEEGAAEVEQLAAAGRLERWRRARGVSRKVGHERQGAGSEGVDPDGAESGEEGGNSPREIVKSAVATVLTSMDYLAAAMVLFHSLQDACGITRGNQQARAGRGGSQGGGPWVGATGVYGRQGMTVKVDLVLLVSNALLDNRDNIERVAEEAGLLVHWVGPIASPHRPIGSRDELTEAYTKLHAFNLTGYSKVVYLDADVLVYRCEIPILLRQSEFVVAGNPTGPPPQHARHWIHHDALAIGTSLMVLQPDKQLFDYLVRESATAESFDGSDRGLIHTLIPDYVMLLPHYVAWKRTAVQYKAVWTDDGYPVAAVDMTGRPKPWEPGSLGLTPDAIDKGNYLPLYLEWWSEYLRWAAAVAPPGPVETWHTGLVGHVGNLDQGCQWQRDCAAGRGGLRGERKLVWQRWLAWYLENVEASSERAAADVPLLLYEPGYYTPDAGYATFKDKHPIGMGNRMVQVASAAILAMVTKRRLLINWNDPEPLTRFLRPVGEGDVDVVWRCRAMRAGRCMHDIR